METQTGVLLLSSMLMLIVLLAFVFVARNSGEVREYSPIQAAAYSFRAKLFWSLMVLGVIVATATLTNLPYATANTNQQVIEVVGHQWYWEVSGNEVEVGKPVVFNVTSGDVNHGLGIYDDKLRIVAQTQAMPDYINKLQHTFEKTGTYKFLCLEFCGLAHHAMVFELNVVAKK